MNVTPRLRRLRAALEALDDAELEALQEASGQTVGIAPGLFAWLEHVADWELARRDGQKFLLRFPEEAIEPEDAPEALAALGALAATFRNRGRSSEIDELLAAAAELLRGQGELH